MNTFPFQAILFDLDGTLVESSLDLTPAVNHALALAGRDSVPEKLVRGFIGGGAPLMLARALEATGGQVGEAQMEELTQALLEYYWAHIADFTVPYPGLLAALDDLAAKGCKLAVCTNKLEKPARALIEELGMSGRFAAIYGGDTLGPGRAKPMPDMLLAAAADCGVDLAAGGRAAMIGDSTYDVRAARAAGMPVVTYAHGYNDVPVEELGGDVLIDHFDELVGALASLG